MINKHTTQKNKQSSFEKPNLMLSILVISIFSLVGALINSSDASTGAPFFELTSSFADILEISSVLIILSLGMVACFRQRRRSLWILKNCKIVFVATLSLAFFSLSANATILIDFGTSDTSATTGTDIYNTIANSAGTAANHDFGTGINGGTPNGFAGTALVDDTGAATAVGFTLDVFNNGPGQTRGFNVTSGADSVAAGSFPGVEDFAVGDAFLVNNHTGNGTNTFGIDLTFTGLTAGQAYDIAVIGGTTAQDPSTYQVIAGTGDTDIENIAGVNAESLVQFQSVFADASGNITLRNTVNSSGTFQNTTINFASIMAVPEPSSVIFLGLGWLALLARRSRRALT